MLQTRQVVKRVFKFGTVMSFCETQRGCIIYNVCKLYRDYAELNSPLGDMRRLANQL
jgi:hypothetical protein